MPKQHHRITLIIALIEALSYPCALSLFRCCCLAAGDKDALVRFLRSLNPRSRNAVSAWTPDLIPNQARWGATQAVLLLREYKPCYDALVDALESGGDLGQCIVAIEEAAKREKKGWLQMPLGIVLEEGELGKWVTIDEVGGNRNVVAPLKTIISFKSTHGVPTYGEDPLTSTEKFLEKYRDVMEKKLASIDKKLVLNISFSKRDGCEGG